MLPPFGSYGAFSWPVAYSNLDLTYGQSPHAHLVITLSLFPFSGILILPSLVTKAEAVVHNLEYLRLLSTPGRKVLQNVV
jgi:hypothetical protein